MAEVENHFTVFVRLPFNRGDFIDPPPVSWSAAKETALWSILSRQAKGNEVDWHSLSEKFEVSQSFLLQQAAWLYERQLSQVRAQMRRVGNNRQSATPSPVPGGSVSASTVVGGQAMKRGGSGGSRVPSRLSTQALGSPVTTGDSSVPGTPAKSRTSLPFRSISGAAPPSAAATVASQTRVVPSSSTRPMSRQSFKDAPDPTITTTTQSRRGSGNQHQVARSPVQARNPPQQPQSSDSEDEMTQSRIAARRPNPSSMHRRALSQRKDLQHQRGMSNSPVDPDQPLQQQQQKQQQLPDENENDDDDDDDDDSPSFLPFAAPTSHNNTETARNRPSSSSHTDPSATLRGGLNIQQTQPPRPGVYRRGTSERVSSPIAVEPPTPVQQTRPSTGDLTSSTSSLSSATQPSDAPTGTTAAAALARPRPTDQARSGGPRLASTNHPLSPPHRALLGSASSPRRLPGPGSDTSPSMGSSFSDLDDASVTQSALEEALLSGMGNTTMTMPGAPSGGVAGRVSGISQALRSRYFDARGEGPAGQRGAGGGGGGVSER
jgi:hypothetical protein